MLHSPPSGKVTFLFTDIEGSTKLAQEFQDKLPAALMIHNSIIREAVESHNGFVFKTVGDAFCCAFENSFDALSSSVEAQEKLNNEDWGDAIIRVRMGIHTGHAEWNNHDYNGYVTLARTHRLMSSAYGGQILISESTRESLMEDVLNKISFRDLGNRRLKDLIQPMRIYQIISSGLPAEFPPIKTLDARPNNLPVQLTTFVGRESVVEQVKNLFRQTHLLTLVGSGGSGKTRLALQVAADMIDEFDNGVYVAELAPVFDPSLIVQTILNALERKEESGKTPKESLTEFLKDKNMMIILDNCEHLIDECAVVVELLLSKCGKLKIFATSREALNCSGEQTYRVPSLSLPDISANLNADILTQYESVRLFIDRAVAVNPDFNVNNSNAPSLAEICARLDGIPLAIELAAARTKILSVEKICERLDDRFNLLTGGKRTALPRQQTLKALVDWSYELLSDREQILWNRLSVFNGGWTLEAAEEICCDDDLGKEKILDLLHLLAEKSVIVYEEDKERFRILESLKQYGKDKLNETNETVEFLSRHLKYFMEVSETAEPNLSGSEILMWLNRLEADHLNMQSAVEWSINAGDREAGARLAGALWRFWDIRGHFSTGRKLIDSILNNVEGISDTTHRKLLLRAAQLARFQCDFETAQKYYEESLKISIQLNERPAIAECINGLGNMQLELRNFDAAQRYYEESLLIRKEIGDKLGLANSLHNLGNLYFVQGDLENGRKYYEDSLELKREIGEKRGIANTLHNLGNLAFDMENNELGRRYSEESLALRRELGDKRGISESLYNIGNASMIEGNYEQALGLFEESITLCRELGEKRDVAKSLNNIGNIKLIQERYDEALKCFKESLVLAMELKNHSLVSANIMGVAGALSYLNDVKKAVKLIAFVETYDNIEGVEIDPDKHESAEAVKNKLRERVADNVFNELYDEGSRLTLEQAAELAISIVN